MRGRATRRRRSTTIDGLKDGGFGVFRDYHAALIADLANDLPEATKRFKTAYATDKTILRLVDAYARFESRHGATAEAERAYTAFGDVLPHHPLIDAALADLKAGKPLAAPGPARAQEGAAEVLYGLGAAGGRQGDELAAMIYLRLSLYLAPQNSLAVVTLADIYGRLKQNEQAIDVYGQVPDASPLRDNADIQTGLTLDVLGRPDEAVKFLQGIIAEHPEGHRGADHAGQYPARAEAICATRSRPIRTRSPPCRPTTRPPGACSISGRSATSATSNGRRPRPTSSTRSSSIPDQPLVLNYLGYSWVDRGVHLDEAFKMLRQAVALRPGGRLHRRQPRLGAFQARRI